MAPGTTEIYLHEGDIHRYTYRITVQPKPVPEVHEITVHDDKYTTIHLPEGVGYRYAQISHTNVQVRSIRTYRHQLQIQLRALENDASEYQLGFY